MNGTWHPAEYPKNASVRSLMPRCLPRQMLAVACPLLLTGCLLGPNYVRPTTPEGRTWFEPLGPGLSGAAADRAQLATWWNVLDDLIPC